MILAATLSQPQALGSPTILAHNEIYRAGENQFACKMGDDRALAKKIKADQALGLKCWATGNCDAQLLATLTLDDEFDMRANRNLPCAISGAGHREADRHFPQFFSPQGLCVTIGADLDGGDGATVPMSRKKYQIQPST
jgi:hypothetical protein